MKKQRPAAVRLEKDRSSGTWVASCRGVEGRGPGPLPAVYDLFKKAEERRRVSDETAEKV